MIKHKCSHDWKEFGTGKGDFDWCKNCGSVRELVFRFNTPHIRYHAPKTMIKSEYPWNVSRGIYGKPARRRKEKV